jgi:glycosyltransferase involved in cell wall biosynthesis
MIARNAGPIIERCLRSVMDHVEEVLVVDTGSDDDTKSVIARVCPKAKVFDFTHVTHQNAFILDVERSWERKIPGPFTGRHQLADFAAARQFGWEKAKSEFALWIDCDDTVEGADKLVEVTDDMRARRATMAMLNYDYEHDVDGHVTMRLTRERIVWMKVGGHWSQPVHEVFLPKDGGFGTFYKQVNIVHHRTKDKLPPLWHSRNLKILVKYFETHKKEVDDNTIDPRLLFNMGMESRFLWPEYALDCFRKYTKRSGWDEERSTAHFLSGTIHERAGRWHDAKQDFAMMTVEFPQNADGFFGLARTAYHVNDWHKVIEWTERGFEVAAKGGPRPTMMMEDPHDRKWRPHVFLSAALVNTGEYTRAVAICEEGLKGNRTEPHLIGNLQEARKMLRQQAQPGAALGSVNLMLRMSEPLTTPPLDIPHDILAMMSVQLWKRALIESGDKALKLLESLPAKIKEDKKVDEALRLTKSKMGGAAAVESDTSRAKEVATGEGCGAAIERRTDVAPVGVGLNGGGVSIPKKPLGRLEYENSKPEPVVEVGKQPLKIAIWTGPAWEAWSPESLKTGIGGSETAAIFMAAELARRGHQVWLLGMHDGRENDVEYVHHDRALKQAGPWKDLDVFIVSRQPLVLHDASFSWRAAYVWCHDIHCGAAPEVKTALLKADAVLALSSWHKSHLHHTYPFLGDHHVVKTRNGIATGRFGKKPNKVGNKLIYASSPDRGIERLLSLWPRIRAEVSNAELEIYYGFNTWRMMCQGFSDQKGLERIAYYEDLLTAKAPPGVKFMGRVGQNQLAEAYLKAKVWAYPTWFSETSCISAMEAQAGGCVPVTSALAALEETVRHGFLLNGAENTREYGDAFVSTVVKLLKDEVMREEYAAAGRTWAMGNLGWDLLVREWEALFLSTLARKTSATGEKKRLVMPAYEGL